MSVCFYHASTPDVQQQLRRYKSTDERKDDSTRRCLASFARSASSSHAALAEGVFSGTCGSFGRHHAGCLMGCVCCQSSHAVGCFGKQIGSCRIVGSFSAHRERQLASWRWPWNDARHSAHLPWYFSTDDRKQVVGDVVRDCRNREQNTCSSVHSTCSS